MFLALTFGGPLAPADAMKLNRAVLARETGWTLDEIDAMDYQDVEETLAIFDACDRARAWAQGREARRAAPARRGRR